MENNKFKAVKKVLDENNVNAMNDEQFVKLLEEENVNSDGSKNALEQTGVVPLNDGCGIMGC
ncbi:hypothetical protein JYG23_12015 [Sedimentibacter sp. zth1]|uniref:hypothetical protein n=1 Tax=Sedimentibacter sp. zth1 TaxID=2816908 RepID=UPI001A93407E|nr:hypothetical protein [Sedimentibacter sp. zth1]QSX05393.1 hypothetical protein JYG23_12015 [Sedimentibacter sp. zth1]